MSEELPELHYDALPLTQYLHDGVSNVQFALRSKLAVGSFEVSDVMESDRRGHLEKGIASLTQLWMALDVEPPRLEYPSHIVQHNSKPRDPLVISALKAIAFSRAIDRHDQYSLFGTWAKTASSGKGRNYPVLFIAKAAMPSILDDVRAKSGAKFKMSEIQI